MKVARRRLLRLVAGAAAVPSIPPIAWPQAYPARPVRIIVGYAAGGGVDIIARLTGQWLSERLGQQFLIENRAGAATNIGTEAVIHSAPDGYTLLLVNAANAINATLYEGLNFVFLRDIVAVGGIIRVPLVVVVNPSLPARSIAEFIAYANANPGRINMASGGAGGPDHMAGALFMMMARVTMTHVPYRGLSPALNDLLGGQVQVVFSTFPAAIEYIRAGALRALAVTTASRFPPAPDIPSVADSVPGYEASQWYGIGAPRNTPVEIIDRLNREINAGLADPTMKTRFAGLGGTVLAGSPADFGRLIAAETEKWARVVKLSGAKAQ